MLRIIGGTFRSRQLDTPDVNTTKPTMDRVRAGIFSALSTDIYNANVLDLFAGSGSFGLESLSRGASKATFVELNDKAFLCVQRNAAKLNVYSQVDMFKEDVLSYLNRQEANQFDIIFADPPYKLGVYGDLLDIVINKGLLKEKGILVLESEKSLNITNPYFSKIKEYKYGLAHVTILRR